MSSLYIENMLFWSHPDKRPESVWTPRLHLFFPCSTAAACRAEICWQFSLLPRVCVRVIFCFQERRNVRRRHAQALCFTVLGFPLRVYRVYMRGGLTHTQTHTHTHTPNPRAIMSNLQVGLSVRRRRNRKRLPTITVAVRAGRALKTRLTFVIFRILWRFSKWIREIYTSGVRGPSWGGCRGHRAENRWLHLWPSGRRPQTDGGIKAGKEGIKTLHYK